MSTWRPRRSRAAASPGRARGALGPLPEGGAPLRPAGDWTEALRPVHEDATMIVSGGVKVGRAEAMKRWYREALGEEPMRSLHYYPSSGT